MVSQFDKHGRGRGRPATAPSDGNVVAAVRGDGALVKTISTVDNANTTQGQVVAALATGRAVQRGQGRAVRRSAPAPRSMMPQQPQ